MKKSKIFKIILFIIAAAIVISFLLKRYFLETKFEYAGTIEATKIDIPSQLSSIIKNVLVEEGDKIFENQLLIQLDCDEVRLAAELAATNYKRNLTLLNSGTVSQDAFDQVKNQKEAADVRMSWCNISAPINGTVLTRYHEPGELALPGTKILTVANIKDVYAYIYVPEPDVAALKVGQKLKATLSEHNNKEFIGTIIKINSEAEFTPKNVQTQKERERLVYGVKVSFLGVNQEEILKPGMTIYIASLNAVKVNEH